MEMNSRQSAVEAIWRRRLVLNTKVKDVFKDEDGVSAFEMSWGRNKEYRLNGRGRSELSEKDVQCFTRVLFDLS
jgi:hypothetical protein